MAQPWNTVESDADYKALPDAEKQKVKDRYFSNVVSADSDFKKLPPDQQEAVKTRFYGTSASNHPPKPQDPSQSYPTGDMRPDIDAAKSAVGTLLSPQKTASAVAKGVGEVAGSAPVQAAVKAVEDRPELQPITTSSKPEMPTGGPIEQGVKAAGQTFALPLRAMEPVVSQTIQNHVQKKTTDALLKQGVRPFVAVASGMLAGTMADPMMAMGVASIGMDAMEGMRAAQELKIQMMQERMAKATKMVPNAEGVFVEPIEQALPEVAPIKETPHALMESVQQSGGAMQGQGKPYALYLGEQEGVGPMYNVYGEHPQLSGPGNHSTVGPGVLQKEGIPVIGKEVPKPKVNFQDLPIEAPKKIDMSVKLPKELSGAKPNYGYGSKQFTLQFASDVDKAAYITAQKTPSKRDADYLKFAMKVTGMDEEGVRAYGRKVREGIKGMAKNAEPGELGIPVGSPESSKASAPKPPEHKFITEEQAWKNHAEREAAKAKAQAQPAQFDNQPSKDTADLPAPETASYGPVDKPTKLQAQIDRSTQEITDLSLARDMDIVPGASEDETFENIFRQYSGSDSLGQWNGHALVNDFAERLPDPDRRSLLTMIQDLGRVPTKSEIEMVRDVYAKAKGPEAKAHSAMLDRLSKQDLTLSLAEKENLAIYKDYYVKHYAGAKKLGILDKARRFYGGGNVYLTKAEANQGSFRRSISGRTVRAMHREYKDFIEAAKDGMVMKDFDSAVRAGIYNKQMTSAAAEKYLLDTLHKNGMINYVGEGTKITGFSGGRLNRVITSEETGLATTTGEIVERIPYATNPKIAKALQALVDHSAVFDHEVFRAVEKINGLQKAVSLFLGTFHMKALFLRAVASGISVNDVLTGMKLIEQQPELVASYIRAGLEINDVKDMGINLAKMSVDGNKGLPLSFVRKTNDIYSDFVFRKMMVGYKVQYTNVLVQRYISMGIPRPERALQLAVMDANKTFGNLNLRLMHRSSNMQRLTKLLVFAQDWTESNIRKMGGALNIRDESLGGVGKYIGMGNVTADEAKVVGRNDRKFWVRAIGLATISYIAEQYNPAKKVIDVNMAHETGVQDALNMLGLVGVDVSYKNGVMNVKPGFNARYLRGKASAITKDFASFMDPHLNAKTKFRNAMEAWLPIPMQPGHILGRKLRKKS